MQREVGFDELHGWKRSNNMVISWILNSLSKQISKNIVYITIAREIWLELEERYRQSNSPQLFQFQKELSQICQGSRCVTSCFTKIKRLWDEIQALRKFPICSCGAVQELQKLEENQKLLRLLMGLNESYNLVKTNILMMKPFPTVRQAYSLLIQEEKQRKISSGQ